MPLVTSCILLPRKVATDILLSVTKIQTGLNLSNNCSTRKIFHGVYVTLDQLVQALHRICRSGSETGTG